MFGKNSVNKIIQLYKDNSLHTGYMKLYNQKYDHENFILQTTNERYLEEELAFDIFLLDKWNRNLFSE